MKRIICYFLFVLSIAVITTGYTNDNVICIDFSVGYVDPSTGYPDPHKGPTVIPSVSIDDHTLYFGTPCDGCTLNVVDSNDVVVYTTVIPVGATSLVLPSTLSGEYELQIIQGNYCFYGPITL